MTHKNRLLILTRDSTLYAELLKRFNLTNLEPIVCDSIEKAKKWAEHCNIILGEPTRIVPILEGAKSLQWVQSIFAGVEALVSPPQRSDYILTGVKGVFGPLMSEYVFVYILALERHIFEVYDNQKERVWKKIPYESLQGKLLGICGLGSIGRHIAQTAKHFGMKVWGYKRSYEEVPEVDRIFAGANFGEFLSNPDYLVITLPSTPETMHFFDYDAFHAMKRTSVLISIGRGNVVSERALVRALEEKLIRGAVLDVFEEEPLPGESPLWALPNVVITPHNSGFSFPEDIVKIFAENYRRFVDKKPLKYIVDFSRGY
ncbi:MAG: D-2-hydroxyacid dehydrogenase [Proteobacteria bacterium]|nr:D-2-hydroxyacid dehydrogenase [Pseudomonadota bacterium]